MGDRLSFLGGSRQRCLSGAARDSRNELAALEGFWARRTGIFGLMDLPKAIETIDTYLCRLDNAYGRPVFDEWAIVTIDGRMVLHYCGQRAERFNLDFADEMRALRTALRQDGALTFSGGEFGFTREGEGSAFDAYICLGPTLLVVCNHTQKSMAEITSDPNWVKAQGIFFDLSQRFATEPLTLASLSA